MPYQDPYLYNDPYQFQPYQYTGYQAYGQPAPLSYEQQQQQQQQGGGMNPMQGLNMANKMGLFGGGEAAGGNSLVGGMEGSAPWQNIFGGGGQTAGSLQGGGAMGSQGGGAMVGNAGGAAGGGQGMGGAMAAAGPWMALAAAVIGTEISGKDEGRRGDDENDWFRHAFGKGLSRDTEYATEKMFGKDMRNDKLGIGSDMNAVTNLMSLDFSNAWSDFKDGSLGKIFSGIGDLF